MKKLVIILSIFALFAALTLTGCPGPQGQDGSNGIDGINGTNGQDGKDGKAAPIMTPLWLGTFPVILEDQGGQLEAKTVDWIQDALTQFANSGSGQDIGAMSLLTGSRGNRNLRIVVEYVPYETGELRYRVIDGRTVVLCYEAIYSLTQSQIYTVLAGALRATSNAPLE